MGRRRLAGIFLCLFLAAPAFGQGTDSSSLEIYNGCGMKGDARRSGIEPLKEPLYGSPTSRINWAQQECFKVERDFPRTGRVGWCSEKGRDRLRAIASELRASGKG